MKPKLLPLIAAALLLFCACDNDHYTEYGGEITTMSPEKISQARERALAEAEEKAVSLSVSQSKYDELHTPKKTINNREGGYSNVPDSVDTIISGSPAITEILIGLGLGDKIIKADRDSAGIYGLDPVICDFDPSELASGTTADLVFLPGKMNDYHFNRGNIAYIPPSASIEGIKLDIEYIAVMTGTQTKAPELIGDINTAVLEVKEAAYGIPPKSVYYEIEMGLTPGYDTLVNEVITIAGGTNIFGSLKGNTAVTPEEIKTLEPDVILLDKNDPDLEISARPGWGELDAVKNDEVHILYNPIRPSQKITEVLYEISNILTENTN
ncbi:MAG: ABC transporter substrate-binding protein [Ruminococcus sp.]|jgi:iron complex transport system substrate-binding protein|nr:ABC transporter substrate-binding protein [Ruminococcus sp.]